MSASPNEPISFAAQIKPLFRDSDVKAMEWAFDLHSYADVKEHASDILNRIGDGSMPCDAPWPEDRIATFRRWIDSGMAE